MTKWFLSLLDFSDVSDFSRISPKNPPQKPSNQFPEAQSLGEYTKFMSDSAVDKVPKFMKPPLKPLDFGG